MFDTIAGLPMHPLVVHAVVVLLPLTALATIAVALRPRWRAAAAPVAVAAALMVLVSFAAKESGEALQRRLTSLSAAGSVAAQEHGEKGDLVPILAFVLFVAAVLVWYARRHPAFNLPAMVIAVVVGLGTIGWTVAVGDSGAREVWGQTVESTSGS